jgi:glycosyltransferase involved in cell wall biosynthesis
MGYNMSLTESVNIRSDSHEIPVSDRCLSVVMPCYNEAKTIEQIIRRVLRQPSVAELIIVDDGSTDGTWEKLQPWASREARIRLLRHERNQGKGAAVRHGFETARAPVVVVQDADLEYDPSDYARLLEALLTHKASVVYGSRFAPGAQASTAGWHRGCNRLLTLAANLITGQRLTDEATCYKMMKREMLLELGLEEDGFGLCPEVTAKLSRLGIKIMEVPINYEGRTRAQGKKLRLRDGWRALYCLWKYTFRNSIHRANSDRK